MQVWGRRHGQQQWCKFLHSRRAALTDGLPTLGCPCQGVCSWSLVLDFKWCDIKAQD